MQTTARFFRAQCAQVDRMIIFVCEKVLNFWGDDPKGA